MSWDPDAFARALDFAAHAHGDQKVPGSGLPYVTHVTKVAQEVLRACAAEPKLDATLAVCCALLHDTIEDAQVSVHALVELFGDRVAFGVQALSKDPALPKDARMADSLRRIRQAPKEVWAVKLADRVTNLEPPPPHWTLEKRRAYADEAQVILDALREGSPWLAARLEARLQGYRRGL